MLSQFKVTARDRPGTDGYAVIFRTHFWDDFVQRQFDRLVARVVDGHVYVLVDETNGHVDGIKHDRVVRMTEQDMLDMGLAKAGTGNLLWYNGDYPLYYFSQIQPDYSYYLQVEYDVVLNTDIDALVRQVAKDRVHFVATENLGPANGWYWRDTCVDYYPAEEVSPILICISIFSRESLTFLKSCRLAQSERFRAGGSTNWPMCEGFVGTEMKRSGLLCADLSEYGSIAACKWWPPNLESELPAFEAQPFVHPILDVDRYVGSVLKSPEGVAGYINLNSVLHRKLRKLPLNRYVQAVLSGFTKKFAKRVGFASL
jgi:hypothetical protein